MWRSSSPVRSSLNAFTGDGYETSGTIYSKARQNIPKELDRLLDVVRKLQFVFLYRLVAINRMF